MKSIVLSLCILSALIGYGQTECSPYVPVTVGSKWEITNYSDKGKEEGKSAYELLEKSETDSGIVFIIQTIVYDKKGKETYNDKFQAICSNGQFKIDMSFRMNGMGMENYEDMDMDITSTNMEIPTMNSSPGTKLNDAMLTIKVSSNSMNIFTMVVEISDRKIEASEGKQTPAGTFDCLVLYQKTSTKTIMTTETYSREWYAEDVGMVRSEIFNKNKKLMGYSELTKLDVK